MELTSERIGEVREYLKGKLSIEASEIETYQIALTHSTCGTPNNQALAFLGDRVFDMIVVEDILQQHPDYEKGMLELERKRIHNRRLQARMARRIGLVAPMLFGKTCENTPKAELERNVTIMAEALEALLGAIYLDKGLEKAREVLLGLLSTSTVPSPP